MQIKVIILLVLLIVSVATAYKAVSMIAQRKGTFHDIAFNIGAALLFALMLTKFVK